MIYEETVFLWMSQIYWDSVGPHAFSGRSRQVKKALDESVKSVKSVRPAKPFSISRLAKKGLDKSVKSVKTLPIFLLVKKSFG